MARPDLRVRRLARYRFVTDFVTTAPPEAVYGALLGPAGWVPGWGEALRVEQVGAGDAHGRGLAFDAAVRAPAGYTIGALVRVVEAERPERLVAQLTGDLEGTGVWLLEAVGATGVSHTWAQLELDVRTTRAWLHAASRVARPLLEWSHGRVMRHAALAAAAHLGADLHDFRSTPAR